MRVLFKGVLSPQHSVGGRAPFIPVKAAQWCFEAKKIDFYEKLWKYLDRLPGLAPGYYWLNGINDDIETKLWLKTTNVYKDNRLPVRIGSSSHLDKLPLS